MDFNNMENNPRAGRYGGAPLETVGGMPNRTLSFTAPPQMSFDTEEMRGSMQQILAQNIGEYVVVEFLIGTEMITRKQGILYHVGVSYVTLFDESARNFIVCDLFSIKFVYFYLPGDRPSRNFNVLPTTNTNSSGSGARR